MHPSQIEVREPRSEVRVEHTIARVKPVGLSMGGLDAFIRRSAVITTCEPANTLDFQHLLTATTSLARALWRISVETTVVAERSHLDEALLRLSWSDLSVQCYADMSDDNGRVVAAVSENHLRCCLERLQSDMALGVELFISRPGLVYREAIHTKSSKQLLTKASNAFGSIARQSRSLVKSTRKAGFNTLNQNNLWYQRAKSTRRGQLVDHIVRVARLDVVKEPAINGFRWATRVGVLCGEPIDNLRINLEDASIHRAEPYWRPI